MPCAALSRRSTTSLKVRARKGYTVLYVGHQGHEEAVGTMAVAPQSVHLIESTEDIDALGTFRPAPSPCSAQTTLSLDEWQDLREYAEAKFPGHLDAQSQRSLFRDHQPPSRAPHESPPKPTRSS